jgi:hypothetical protein
MLMVLYSFLVFLLKNLLEFENVTEKKMNVVISGSNVTYLNTQKEGVMFFQIKQNCHFRLRMSFVGSPIFLISQYDSIRSNYNRSKRQEAFDLQLLDLCEDKIDRVV